MEFEAASEFVNKVLLEQIDRVMTEAEAAILAGAWYDQTYEQIAETCGYSLNYLQRNAAPKFWKLLNQVLQRQLNKTNARAILIQLGHQEAEGRRQEKDRNEKSELFLPSPPPPLVSPEVLPLQVDWGEAPDVSVFYGRSKELNTLTQWIEHDRCKLIALLGMGGIGKSCLATKVAYQVIQKPGAKAPNFEFCIWRSLRNAPPLETLLSELVAFLSQQQDTQAKPERLLHWLRQSRCFVILDNVETILQPGDRAGHYQPEYENYGDLLRLLGETQHQSCVLLTSREKPAEISTFEGADGRVRSLSLSGSWEASLAMLESKQLVGTEAEKSQLCEFYNCSPLALKIVAASVQSLFDGEIAPFLAEATMVFNGLRRLLDQQFERLSYLEKTIMYWLAINREWTGITELVQDIVPMVSRANLMESLESLTWRSLVETRSGKYTQQPVVMEYVTENLIQQIATELITAKLSLFSRHALIKTTVLDYIHESQMRLILQRITAQITDAFHSPDELKQCFQGVLQKIRQLQNSFFGYDVGNLINLCLYLQLDLADYDCSGLKIRQVNFQGKRLSRLNLTNANLRDCLFTQPFGGILAVGFSPDNRLLALGDSNGTIRLWQTASHQGDWSDLEQPYSILSGHLGWIMDLAWSPDGQRLVSASDDYTVKLWDGYTGKCLETLQGHQKAVWAVAWSPDGKIIASGSGDHTIKLWDAATGLCLKTLQGHESLIYSIDWHPNGHIFASSSEDHAIRLWDGQTGECLKVLTLDGAWVRRVAWRPDGKILASGSSDRLIRLWDGQTGNLIRTLAGHAIWIDSLRWSPDGKTLASGSSDRTIKLWNPETGECLQTLQGHQDPIWGLHWSPDGTTLISASHDQTVRFWNTEIGQCRRILQGYIDSIRQVAWSPDGKQLVCGSTDRTVRIWDVATGHCQNTLTEHLGWIFSVDWNPTQPLIASGGTDASIKLWDAQTGRCIKTIYGHTSWVWSVAWSPDGSRLASGSSMNDLTARVWNPTTGECLLVLAGHESWIWWVAWSPDGTILATAADDRMIKIWDSQTGECLRTLHDDRLLGIAIAWSPDSHWLATSSTEKTIRLWNLQTGRCEREFVGHQAFVWAISWSPDGNWLASGGDDGTVRIWDLRTDQCIHTLLGHQSRIWSTAWSPDGRMVASSSADATIQLWDVQAGTCVRVLRSDRPYEGMTITGVTGITEAQKATLMALGAVDHSS